MRSKSSPAFSSSSSDTVRDPGGLDPIVKAHISFAGRRQMTSGAAFSAEISPAKHLWQISPIGQGSSSIFFSWVANQQYTGQYITAIGFSIIGRVFMCFPGVVNGY